MFIDTEISINTENGSYKKIYTKHVIQRVKGEWSEEIMFYAPIDILLLISWRSHLRSWRWRNAVLCYSLEFFTNIKEACLGMVVEYGVPRKKHHPLEN